MMVRVLTITLLCISLLSLSRFTISPNDSNALVASIKRNYLVDLEEFNSSAKKYSENMNAVSNAKSVETLREQHKALRSRYKHIEYLIEYIDLEFVKENINAAPIPKIQRSSTNRTVVQPRGLQIIEEILFSDDALTHKEELSKLSADLSKDINELVFFHEKTILTDRQVFEAARMHMIRISTLGVTGFDSPAQLSLSDIEISVSRLAKDFSHYYALISSRDAKLAENIKNLIEGSILYVKQNNDFETFNRAEFLRSYINPLYKNILEAQLTLGIETLYETSDLRTKHSVNYMADNLFDPKLLDPVYYVRAHSEKMNKKVATLGQMLFFDPILSKNNERACSSCHNPEKAFSDGQKKSLSYNFSGTLERNAPTLINAVYAEHYFYDFRSETLEEQVNHVIGGPKEFNESYLRIFDKLKQSDEYMALFRESFPEVPENELISVHTIQEALAIYVASLTSFNSPFDAYIRGETDEIDAQVIDGFNVFMGKAQCGTCHFAPVFNGLVPPVYHESETEVLGVPATKDTVNPKLDADPGRFGGKLLDKADIFKNSFKTTTVRNAALTAPYMHNGVFDTLEEVIDFYNKGGGHGLGLDVPNQTLPTDPLELNEKEIGSLVAFIEALSDTTGLVSRPARLPDFPSELGLNNRKIGGEY